MTPLAEIKQFPEVERQKLQDIGITSAEVFFEHSVRDFKRMQTYLNLTWERLSELQHMVVDYFSDEFVQSCIEPLNKHPRGVISD